MKRKHIDFILNSGNSNKKKFTESILNFVSNKQALMDLYYCSSKQVETRKMDTKLSMASQCMDTYKDRVERDSKELEESIGRSASNPAFAITGMAAMVAILSIIQKARLYREKMDIIKNELDIAKIVNHIDSVNEQKIKDALTILYKLKNHDGSQPLVISNSTDKETLIDVKKDFFYSELLILSKEKINLYGNEVALEDLSFSENNAFDNLKAILQKSNNKDLLNEVVGELNQQKEEILSDKRVAYYIEEENNLMIFTREKEEELKKIQEEFDKAKASYSKAYSLVPDIKNQIDEAKNVFDASNLKDIKDESTQKELRSMLRNMSKIQDTIRTIKNDLSFSEKKFQALKRERESITPYIDILNEEGRIDSKKLSIAIKEHPDKIITMFNNLESIKNDSNKDMKKMLIFNIIDRAANKNGSDLTTSDFFSEIMNKVMPYNKNIIEDLSDYEFSSSLHPNNDKIILNISNKLEKDSFANMSEIKEAASDFTKKLPHSMEMLSSMLFR